MANYRNLYPQTWAISQRDDFPKTQAKYSFSLGFITLKKKY